VKTGLQFYSELDFDCFLAAAAKNAERMRKRKSRWAPEGEKVPIPPAGLPIPIIPKGDF
jgi:hypothetical protein